uniref:Uncharacterized protein n=1 Tax=Stomoxys calcitrans TaxID=35570 RepID=A0A1I8PJG7_STOCA
MHLFEKLLLFLACVLTFCAGQRYTPSYNYPVAQRRAGYSYTSPLSYNSVSSTPGATYNKANSGYYSGSNRSRYPSKTYYQPSSSAYRYGTPSSYHATRGYSGSSGAGGYPSAVRGYSTSPASTNNRYYSQGSTKDYLTNTYNRDYKSKASSNTNKPSKDKSPDPISKADAENAKFAGASNQEQEDESARTNLHFKRKKLLRRRLAASSYGNRCLPYGRDASSIKSTATPPPKEQGRFLFDLNVYNVYPQTSVGIGNGCGGFGGSFGGSFGAGGGIFGDALGFGGGGFPGLGGGGGGGGLLSDPLSDPVYPTNSGLNNFLGLWAPGILQNALAVTARPLADPAPSPSTQEDESDPEVDPDYRPPPPVRRPRPNRVYYDSAGASPITPAQLVGGVATTVNGIIQQLTGNVQPVYQSSYRRSYG